MELIFGSPDGSGAAGPAGVSGWAGAAPGGGTSVVRLPDGSLAEISGFGTSQARLVRLHSTNPLAYLAAENQPGAAWSASRGGTPVV